MSGQGMSDERLEELRATSRAGDSSEPEKILRLRIKLGHAVREIDRLRSELKLWKPMTIEEAEAAYEAAEAVPIPREQIEAIVAQVTDPTYVPTEPEHVLLAARVRQLETELATVTEQRDHDRKRALGLNDLLLTCMKEKAEVAARPAGEPIGWHVGSNSGTCGVDWLMRAKPSPDDPNMPKDAVIRPLYAGQPIATPQPLPEPVYRDDKVTLYRNGALSACVFEYPSGYGWRFEPMGPQSIAGTIILGDTDWTREDAEQAAAEWVAGVTKGA